MDAKRLEHSEIQFGQTAIAYTIHRSQREKTVAIEVDPIEGVRVRTPQETPVSKLDEIVHRKAKWVVERRRRLEDLPPPPTPREFVNGETFLYLGRQYRLKRYSPKGNQPARVRLAGGYLHVPVNRSESRHEDVRRLLEEWYRGHAARRLPERTNLWGEKLGLTPTAILIREQRKRWGSVDAKGQVRLNWRIVQAHQRHVDYVLVHELVHLRFPDHTREFWAAVGQCMSDYEARREALRRLGRMMVW